MNTADFVVKYAITSTHTRADANPGMGDMPNGSTHYRVTLKRADTRICITTPFSMGPALKSAPTTSEVLDCLASDASGVLNCEDFHDWCRDFGASPDSRKAEATFRACQQIALDLQRFLGGSLLDELLDCDRL